LAFQDAHPGIDEKVALAAHRAKHEQPEIFRTLNESLTAARW